MVIKIFMIDISSNVNITLTLPYSKLELRNVILIDIMRSNVDWIYSNRQKIKRPFNRMFY